MGLVTTLWDDMFHEASSPACIPGDRLSSGVLGYSAVSKIGCLH